MSNPSVEPKFDAEFNAEYYARLQQACTLQDGLMTTFLSMATRSSGKLLLRSILRQTLEGLAQLTAAEESSLFWLNERGYVTESILARGITVSEQKETVVGQVLERGLAGWVYQKRQVGVVADVDTDERWLELPHQPYVAKSVVCVPIVRGTHLLAIATLMHSQVGFFDAAAVQLIELCATRLGMVLDLLRVQKQTAMIQAKLTMPPESSTDQSEPIQAETFKTISQFVLSEEGKLITADARLGELFHYEMSELIKLGSFFDLVAPSHREPFAQKVAQCLEGIQSKLLVTFRGLSKEGRSLKIEFYGYRATLFGQVVLVARLRGL